MILVLGEHAPLKAEFSLSGKGRAFMARELQVLAVGCVFVFLGAIVVGIF
jgi:hypothetical protein